MIYLHYKDTKTFGHSFSFLLIFKTLRASYLQVGNFSKKINFALNVVNFLNQNGASGSISSADLVTDPSKYKNYLMAGSYIRPFEVSLSTTINF